MWPESCPIPTFNLNSSGTPMRTECRHTFNYSQVYGVPSRAFDLGSPPRCIHHFRYLMRGFRPLSQPIPPLALPRSLRRPWSTIPPITITPASSRGVMSSQREDSIPHELRTAAEPRQNKLYPVRLSHVEVVNPSIRLLRFTIPTQENNVSSDLSF